MRNKYNFVEDSHPLLFGGESWIHQKGISTTVRVALLFAYLSVTLASPFMDSFLIPFTWMKSSARWSLAAPNTMHTEWLNVFKTNESNITKMEIEIGIYIYIYMKQMQRDVSTDSSGIKETQWVSIFFWMLCVLSMQWICFFYRQV